MYLQKYFTDEECSLRILVQKTALYDIKKLALPFPYQGGHHQYYSRLSQPMNKMHSHKLRCRNVITLKSEISLVCASIAMAKFTMR